MSQKTCVTFSLDTCAVPEPGGCETAYIKSGLAPIRVTASTAKLGFSVPRQSVITSPTAGGWTLTIKRGGSAAVLATYTVAEYDSSKSAAIFFVDDVMRKAKKGYYHAEVRNDCCLVAKVVLHVDCDYADAVEVFEFTHDPQPLACEKTELKGAACAAPVCPEPRKLELEC